jgi:GT2 family glycosyltransferase
MESLPHITVIIPTFSRPKQLSDCLGALMLSDYPRERFKIVVVDDDSPMELDPIVEVYRSRVDLTLVKQKHGGPAAARNVGATIARSEFIAFTDDDCVPEPDWLRKLALSLRATPNAAVGGFTINSLTDNPYSEATQLIVNHLYRYFNADPLNAHFFASNNLGAPTDHFRALGGFDARYRWAAAEDRDFCDRWLRSGRGMICDLSAVVRHVHNLTLGSFCRQHWQYGRGAFRFRHARSRFTREGLQFEKLSFYAKLLLTPLSQTNRRSAGRLISTLALSQCAHASGFTFDWMKCLFTEDAKIESGGR